MSQSRSPLALFPLPQAQHALSAAARRWSTSSQTRARRNAMVALTSLAQRRAEREDADAYLDAAVRRSDLGMPEPRRSAESS